MDVSRKLVLDKIAIEKLQGRKIINISTATLEWIDTKLTYAAITARGSPFVSIVAFKHNENKIYHLYSLNTCPELENPDSLENNPKQSYMMLPHNTKISLDGEFMSVTSFDGRVRVVKMPAIIDPIQNEKAHAELTSNSQNLNNSAPDSYQTLDEAQGITISGDLESIQHKDLELDDIQIADVPPIKQDKFEDPYKYTPPSEKVHQESSQADPMSHHTSMMAEPKIEFKYLLGKEHKKDMDGGDAGGLLKTNEFFPYVDFIRSPFCGK